jgi:hypothetical protein
VYTAEKRKSGTMGEKNERMDEENTTNNTEKFSIQNTQIAESFCAAATLRAFRENNNLLLIFPAHSLFEMMSFFLRH